MKIWKEFYPIKLQVVSANLSVRMADASGAIIIPPLADESILTIKLRYFLRVESIEHTYLSFPDAKLNINVDFNPEAGKKFATLTTLDVFLGNVGKVDTSKCENGLRAGIGCLVVEAGRRIKCPVQLKIVWGGNNTKP